MWLTCPVTEIPARKGSCGRLPHRQRVKDGEPDPVEVQKLAEQLPPEAWQRLPLRDTERKELWCRIAVLRVFPVWDELPGPPHWLLIRQNEGSLVVQAQRSFTTSVFDTKNVGKSHAFLLGHTVNSQKHIAPERCIESSKQIRRNASEML